jgi:ribosome-binding protein aMBF1 (putative translation factor)
MAQRTKTGFDKLFDEQMKSRTFAKSYADARTEVDVIDKMVRALDAAREASGMTKADLATALETRPEVVRRLFTTRHPNPTLSTLIRLATTLGYHVELVKNAAPRRLAKRKRVAA